MRYLCISITFLDGLFHGTGDNGGPEWPPSPMRLFQALVAGSRSSCREVDWSENKAKAFRWLGCCEPPMIIGPAAKPAAAYTLFVPNNDTDRKFDRQDRLTAKLVQPHRIVSDTVTMEVETTLHYLWAISEREWREASIYVMRLCDEARHLMALGWGIDQAIADGRILSSTEAAALSGQRWRPWNAKFAVRQKRRVPTKGTLEDLVRAYQAFLKRLSMVDPPKAREPRVFASRAYLRADTLPPRPYAIFELPEGIAFRQKDAAAVAAMLRSLVCDRKNRKDFQQQFPDVDTEVFLAGHVNRKWGKTQPRFSYLALPTIGHEHADGMIRRVVILEPIGGSGAHAQWVQQCLRNQVLRDHEGNERGSLLNLWRKGSSSMRDRYVSESKNWTSVTPVILPGFDDGKHTKAEKLFLRSVQQADLPVEGLAAFTLRKAPFWPGSQHPKCYRRPDYLDSEKDRRFSAWHVHLSFREPIAGPLSIGAGRHCGLGIFAAIG